MNLNPGKCHVSIFTEVHLFLRLTIKKNNIILIKTEVFKDLGIFVSDILKWNHHINYIYRTESILSFQILKSFISTDLETLKKIVPSLHPS